MAVTTDGNGNVYFTGSNCVFRLDQTGTVTRVAGDAGNQPGYLGDGGPATGARLYDPSGVAVDASGNIFIADGTRIRRVSSNGIIVTIAGNGQGGYSGDGGPAVDAGINTGQLALDAAGNIFFADTNGRIRKVAPSGIISTVAGNGTQGFSGDGGPAVDAQLANPRGIAVDNAGDLYIADTGNNSIRKVTPNGTISTIAQIFQPLQVAVDAAGDVYVAAGAGISKVSPDDAVSTIVGFIPVPGFSGDGGVATLAQVNVPEGIALDAAGNIYIADTLNNRIRQISSTQNIISTIAGNGTYNYSGDGGPATSAQIGNTAGIAFDPAGNLYIEDLSNEAIRKILPSGNILTLAGTGSTGFSAFGGLNLPGLPGGLAADASGNVFVSTPAPPSGDFVNGGFVLKVTPAGVITAVAGGGTVDPGDGGPSTSAELHNPAGIAADAAGNVYFTESSGNRVRKVSSAGIISTVAGTGVAGFSGDGGPAVDALLSGPWSIAVDAAGNLYIADTGNARIRQVSTTGIITTIAGGGTASPGDGGLATDADLSFPTGVAVDKAGNIYFSETFYTLNPDNGVRRISPDGTLSTISPPGYAATDTAVDSAGRVYATDGNMVYMLTPTNAPVVVNAVLDGASETSIPLSPGKIVAIYGAGLGTASVTVNQPQNGVFGTQAGGTSVTFNGINAPILYASTTQVAAIVPYEVAGSVTAQVVVTSQSGVSAPLAVPVVAAAPSFFSLNGTGAGQIAAVNANGTINDAAHPVAIGGYISLYATGEGQTSPPGVDGQLALMQPYPSPLLPVQVTIGGVPVTPVYAGAAPTEVAGLMQIVVQIPPGVQPGGYAPVVLQVELSSTVNGAAWIAVSGN